MPTVKTQDCPISEKDKSGEEVYAYSILEMVHCSIRCSDRQACYKTYPEYEGKENSEYENNCSFSFKKKSIHTCKYVIKESIQCLMTM